MLGKYLNLLVLTRGHVVVGGSATMWLASSDSEALEEKPMVDLLW